MGGTVMEAKGWTVALSCRMILVSKLPCRARSEMPLDTSLATVERLPSNTLRVTLQSTFILTQDNLWVKAGKDWVGIYSFLCQKNEFCMSQVCAA